MRHSFLNRLIRLNSNLGDMVCLGRADRVSALIAEEGGRVARRIGITDSIFRGRAIRVNSRTRADTVKPLSWDDAQEKARKAVATVKQDEERSRAGNPWRLTSHQINLVNDPSVHRTRIANMLGISQMDVIKIRRGDWGR